MKADTLDTESKALSFETNSDSSDGDDIYQPRSSNVSAGDVSYQRKPPLSFEERFSNAATIALNSYNSTHQLNFELEHILHMESIVVYASPISTYSHLSFIAKTKDSSRKLKLFFAEVVNREVVKICTPVDPGNPLFPLGCGKCHPQGVIYHPLNKYKIGSRQYFNSYHPGNLSKDEESAKKFLDETYTFKNTIEVLHPEEDNELREITYHYALRALAWYERDKNRSYELLKPLASVRFRVNNVVSTLLDSKHYAHLNFTATNKNLPCIDASPDLFFAELNLDYFYVTTCINLTETVSCSLNSKAETNCLICPEYCPISHPVGEYNGIKYQAGLEGGTFADAQDEYRSWGAKVELQTKVELETEVGTSSNTTRFIGLSSILSPTQSRIISEREKVNHQDLSR